MTKPLCLAVALCVLAIASFAQGKTLIGCYDPDNGRNSGQMLVMDAWQGKDNAVQLMFVNFDESEMWWLWPALETVWKSKKVPVITWQPHYWQQQSPSDIEVRVARGEYDAYLTTFGKGVRDFIAGPDGVVGTGDDRRAYMRFAHEMNGNWYPWSAKTGESTPADYVAMYRRVFNLFNSDAVGLQRSKVANSLLWIWSPINFDVGDFKMDDYYPGAAYVDWVGVTGFNWGTSEGWSGWWDPARLFSESIDRIRAIAPGKPLGITEYSTVPNGGDKNLWINQLFDLLVEKDVRMALYFNVDKNEQSGMKYWSIFGYGGDQDFWSALLSRTFKGWGAYKTRVRANNIIGADDSESRIISNEAFHGWSGAAPPAPSAAVSKPPRNDNDGGSKDNDGAPINTDAKKLKVFSDSLVASSAYNFLSWGSEGTITNPTAVPDPKAPEGTRATTVRTTDWGGFGFFTTAAQGSVSLQPYKRLRFSIASTVRVLIEIEDANGQKWGQYVKATSELAWRTVSLALSKTSVTGSKINFAQVKGLFLATASQAGTFFIDNVYYEK